VCSARSCPPLKFPGDPPHRLFTLLSVGAYRLWKFVRSPPWIKAQPRAEYCAAPAEQQQCAITDALQSGTSVGSHGEEALGGGGRLRVAR
jgi:hypothetical protein